MKAILSVSVAVNIILAVVTVSVLVSRSTDQKLKSEFKELAIASENSNNKTEMVVVVSDSPAQTSIAGVYRYHRSGSPRVDYLDLRLDGSALFNSQNQGILDRKTHWTFSQGTLSVSGCGVWTQEGLDLLDEKGNRWTRER